MTNGNQVEKRDEKGRYTKGTCGGLKGVQKSGRREALALLDEVIGTEENQKLLRAAMQKEFEKNPMQFFMRVVVPLIPQKMILQHKSNNRELAETIQKVMFEQLHGERTRNSEDAEEV